MLSASLSVFAQETDTISEFKPKYQDYHERAVAAVTSNNIVYRGIENTIQVAVFGIDPWDTTVSGPGNLRSPGKIGEYRWNLTAVNENFAKINVVYKLADGSVKTEQREFVIRNIKPLRSLINGHGDYNCIVEQTTEQLKDAKISVVCDDAIKGFRHILVKGFKIAWDGYYYEVAGDSIPEDVYNELIRQKEGTIFSITEIQFTTQASVYACKTSNIKVMIVGNLVD